MQPLGPVRGSALRGFASLSCLTSTMRPQDRTSSNSCSSIAAVPPGMGSTNALTVARCWMSRSGSVFGDSRRPNGAALLLDVSAGDVPSFRIRTEEHSASAPLTRGRFRIERARASTLDPFPAGSSNSEVALSQRDDQRGDGRATASASAMRTRRVGDASPRSMAASAAAANSGVTPDQNTTIDTIAMMARTKAVRSAFTVRGTT